MARERRIPWASSLENEAVTNDSNRGRRVLVTLAAALILALALSACGGGAPEVSNGDPVLEEGRQLYIRNCAGCHGLDGGGATGPQLSGGTASATYPNIKDQIDIVVNGREAMPAFGGKLSGQEVEAVVRYTRETL